MLTVRVSLRSLSLTTPLPVRDRLTRAMDRTLTMVPRWICQNVSGSSSSASSLIGFLIRDSPSRVMTRVYLSCGLEVNHLIHRDQAHAVARAERGYSAGGGIPPRGKRLDHEAMKDFSGNGCTGLQSLLSRFTVFSSRSMETGLSR